MISTHVNDTFAAGDGSTAYKAAIKALQSALPFGGWISLYESASRFCGSEGKQRKDFSIEVN